MVLVMLSYSWILLVYLICPSFSAYLQDEVIVLPGLKHQPTFKHYSGYLQVSPTKFLHYWFVTSQQSPTKDPVVLWLNGGPGCSSMEGMLSENGPFKVQDDMSLVVNPYSWNKIANMLYLEAPAGVGYSYASDRNTSADDLSTAQLNYEALVQFFIKFPEFKTNDFYISGESYAGVYIPTLSVLVVRDTNINFKGMLVGNGLHSDNSNSNSLLYFYFFHGLINQHLWGLLQYRCSCNNSALSMCDFQTAAQQSADCRDAISTVLNAGQYIDPYNMYDPCYQGDSLDKVSTNNNDHPLKFVPLRPAFMFDSVSMDASSFSKQNNRKIVKGKSYSMPRSRILWLDKTSIMAPVTIPCSNDTALIGYMNDPVVRFALHIPSFVQEFDICNENLPYTSQLSDMSPYYKILIQQKIRILIYNGDIDTACNFLGAQWFFDSRGYPTNINYTHWLFSSPIDGSKQVGGFGKTYFTDNRLTLITIRGAGHMVPEDKPLPSFVFFQRFLNNQLIIS